MTVSPLPSDPRVVIIGRPNVGKSSLFNRLLRRRAAIVHAEPGVTRDRLTGTVTEDGRQFTLVDTGGLEGARRDTTLSAVAAAIRNQVENALADAQMALLLVDAQSGLTGLDAAIATDLRRSGMPTLLVVNKCDHDDAEIAAAEFSRLGWSGIPISAAHARGIDELVTAVFERLARTQPLPGPGLDAAPEAPAIRRLAVVGRPNVGKSSLVNAFLREDRVLVSDTPGTTRDAVDVPFSITVANQAVPFILTDTAGWWRPREMRSAVEGFSIRQAEKAVQQCDIALLVMETGRGPTAQDKKIAALIRDHRRAAVMLANKTDLVASSVRDDYRQAVAERLPFMAFYPLEFVSARDGRNLAGALRRVAGLNRRIDLHLPTGPVNRALEKATHRVQPPLVRGQRLKIFYATQTGNNPLTLTLFVNEPTRMRPAYRQFLEHELRRRFPDLEGLPLVLDLKSRRE